MGSEKPREKPERSEEQPPKDAQSTEPDPKGREIEGLKALVIEQEHLLKRVQAEFENSLKRTAREIERAEDAAEARIVSRLLPLVDTIEAGIRSETEGSEAHTTLIMVKKAIDKTLEELNVRLIESDGVRFDPQLHEALMTKDGEDDIVLDVIQHGYRRGDRILRHAKVIVGRNHDES